MKKLFYGCFFICLSVSTVSFSADRVGDFSLLDQNGKFHQMSWYDNNKVIVLLAQDNSCKEVHAAIPAYDNLRSQYQGQGVQFMMLNSTGENDRDSLIAAASEYGIEIPILMDESQIISEALGVDKAGEVFLFDPRLFQVVYRGPIGDHLAVALEQIVAGNNVTDAVVETTGCAVSYIAEEVSYVNDVAPILADNCATCHRERGIAPFSLNDHQSIQGWSAMIKEVVMTRRMPPGQPDPYVGKFLDAPGLSASETRQLISWIDAGAHKDGSSDPLTELVWPDTKWQLGEPDLIIKVPTQEIPSTGVVDYRNVLVPLTELTDDRWVRGTEIAPGNRAVLHHVVTTVLPPRNADGTSPKGANIIERNPEIPTIAGYAPGYKYRFLDENTGAKLKLGSSLLLQLHYVTTGRPETDETEVGLYFYPQGVVPQKRMSGGNAASFDLDIPAYEPNFEVSATRIIDKDSHLISFLPHMHYRGKSMRFTAQYPDGREQLIFSIPKYSFNWQLTYYLAEPLFVPAGTKILAEGVYDNSVQNELNPDPSANVSFGEQSWNEMFFGVMAWEEVDQTAWAAEEF